MIYSLSRQANCAPGRQWLVFHGIRELHSESITLPKILSNLTGTIACAKDYAAKSRATDPANQIFQKGFPSHGRHGLWNIRQYRSQAENHTSHPDGARHNIQQPQNTYVTDATTY